MEEEPSTERWQDTDYLVERLRAELKFPADQRREIEDALMFAASAHDGIPAKVGNEPSLNHPLRVALAANHHFPDRPEMVMAALLHDTVEDTAASVEMIEDRFGPFVADLVEELTRIEGQPDEVYHRSFEGKSLDAQELKLLDRCDSLKSLRLRTLEKQDAYLQDTEHVYLPLARKVGGAIQQDFVQGYKRATAS